MNIKNTCVVLANCIVINGPYDLSVLQTFEDLLNLTKFWFQ